MESSQKRNTPDIDIRSSKFEDCSAFIHGKSGQSFSDRLDPQK
jgi:hypothetical protein